MRKPRSQHFLHALLSEESHRHEALARIRTALINTHGRVLPASRELDVPHRTFLEWMRSFRELQELVDEVRAEHRPKKH
jgi:hypothetical protein